MRASQLVAGGHYALSYGRYNDVVECFVLEPKGWKANRTRSYGYRGEQRPVRQAGAGGTAVLVKRYNNWVPMVVSCTKILRTWAEHSASVREAQERAARERRAAERARARRDDLAAYVNAALSARGMRGSAAGYSSSISLTFEDVVTLLGGEDALRETHGDAIRAERERQAEVRRQREEAERIRQIQLEEERAAAAERRRVELEAERTAAPVASELVAGEVQ